MSKITTDTESPPEEWLSLHEASALLGVATSTLRRWSDAGRIPSKRTIGGHRRFSRSALAQISKAGQPQSLQPSPAATPNWGLDEQELARQEWHPRLAVRPGADRMRCLGQRLLGLLIQYINHQQDDRRFLNEARSVGISYGQEAHEAKVGMHDTVQAFLFFRSAFSLASLPLPGIAQPSDLPETAALYARINRFMDVVLLGVIAGFEEFADR